MHNSQGRVFAVTTAFPFWTAGLQQHVKLSGFFTFDLWSSNGCFELSLPTLDSSLLRVESFVSFRAEFAGEWARHTVNQTRNGWMEKITCQRVCHWSQMFLSWFLL